MDPIGKSQGWQHYLKPFCLIFTLVLLIYSNTFQAEWHLDDYTNITKNPYIQIDTLDTPSLLQTFYFGNKKEISRPFARLTFGLNWFLGKDNVIGYHIVNIFIHQCTAFLLFLVILNLFQAPNIKDKYKGSESFIALLTAVLWAANPIQTQAVTYIVQRMASLAALFYILSMYGYLKGRMSVTAKRRILFFCIAGVSFAFGLATKENTATLPIAIILMEVIFFQDISKPKVRNLLLCAFVIVCIVLVVASSQLFMHGKLLKMFKGSNFRYFTPAQRLMTEARVLIFYLSEIFYPVPARLSIEHDIQLSTSLFTPWTTLPAILFLLLLACLGVLQIRKRPLLSLGILFYLLNHMIESTVIGLELVFEHRNYLPSFFIFLHMSAVIKWMLDQYDARSKVIYSVLIFFVTFMIISFGISTYVRNMTWKTEQSLLEDAVRKAPNAARPLSNLSRVYQMKIGRPDISIKMLTKALSLKKNNRYQESMILSSIGTIYYGNGYDRKAIQYFKEANKKHPGYINNRYKLALALASVGNYQESKAQLTKVIPKIPSDVVGPLNLKGLMLAKEKKYKQAFQMFKRCLVRQKNNKDALINIGALYYMTGNYQKAEDYFKIAYTHYHNELFAVIWLIETNLKTKDSKDVNTYMDRLFVMISAKEMLRLPAILSNRHDFDKGIMSPFPSKLLVNELSRGIKMQKHATRSSTTHH